MLVEWKRTEILPGFSHKEIDFLPKRTDAMPAWVRVPVEVVCNKAESEAPTYVYTPSFFTYGDGSTVQFGDLTGVVHA